MMMQPNRLQRVLMVQGVLRTLSFFGWIVIDLAFWWMLAAESLRRVLLGDPLIREPVGRLLFILVSCFLLSALNNIVTPFDFLKRGWRRAVRRIDRLKLEGGFLFLFGIKVSIGCLCLYGILGNISCLLRSLD